MKKKTACLWAAAVVWMGVIWGLSSIPGDGFPEIGWGGNFLSIAAHFVMYFILAGLLYYAIREGNKALPERRMFLIVFAVTVSYGILDEFHQSFTPGRSPSVRDVAVDAAGALCFLAIAWIRMRSVGGKGR
jgi:VanZ family protein